MKTFQSAHLGTADVAKIVKLSDGKFDDTVLCRLVYVLTTSFESYNPDNTVMAYLRQHAQALRWEHKPDFRPPKEKEKEQDKSKTKDESHPQKRKAKPERKSDPKSSKSKRVRMTDKRGQNPKHKKSSDHCRSQRCRDRGTHTNHSHSDCKFKESDTNKKESDPKNHPNLGRAPGKMQRNIKTNASRPEKHTAPPQTKGSGGARCYICNQPDHLANACSSKGKIKAGAQNLLYKKTIFMATRLLKSRGDDLCPTCMGELSFHHRCDTSDIAIARHTSCARRTSFHTTAQNHSKCSRISTWQHRETRTYQHRNQLLPRCWGAGRKQRRIGRNRFRIATLLRKRRQSRRARSLRKFRRRF
jgi:hypothetical protein